MDGYQETLSKIRVAVPNKKTEPCLVRRTGQAGAGSPAGFLDEKRSKVKIAWRESLDSQLKRKTCKPTFLSEELTAAILSLNLSQADRLYGIWVRNNLARDVEEDVEKLSLSAHSEGMRR